MRDMTDSFAENTRLHRICEILVRNAPAKATVNRITIAARYRTTNPEDIYRQHYLNLWKKNPSQSNWDLYVRAGTAKAAAALGG